MFKRVIWIILDSVGIGELPDADLFGDVGADTLGHIFETIKDYNLPNMGKLGLGNIDGIAESIKKSDVTDHDIISGPAKKLEPVGIYGKAKEVSAGKDTTVGHFEMTGIWTKQKFPTYPNGFPKEIIDRFIEGSGIPGVLCNGVASGTEVIKQYGVEHEKTKKPIVYTSADSVFQIACNEDVYSPEELYRICMVARKILVGKNQVARVIARPFVDKNGVYTRTSNRKDFSVEPEDGNLLDVLNKNNINVWAVGKINDIFCGKGINKAVHIDDNMDGVDKTLMFMNEMDKGLIFTNLVEFDSRWGHRRDVDGYSRGLVDFDNRLPEIISNLRDDDLLIINADHGCDPTFKGTDHTREYIPVLMYGKKANSGVNLHVLNTFADIGQTIADNFGCKIAMGTSRLEEIWKNNII